MSSESSIPIVEPRGDGAVRATTTANSTISVVGRRVPCPDCTPQLLGPIRACGRLKMKHVIAGALSPRIPKGGPK